MTDFIIVGAGIFGRVIGTALDRAGFSVQLYDCKQEHSGSPPAACLMKPSWLGALSKSDLESSLNLLDELFGVQDIKFKMPVGHATVHWTNPKKILNSLPDKVTNDEAVVVSSKGVKFWFGERIEPKIATIVCAGFWTDDLIYGHKVDKPIANWVQGQTGVSFFWPGKEVEPFIKPWAPYKQIVGFTMNKGVWCGDGSAIKHTNWTSERTKQCLKRCADAVHLNPDEAVIMIGIRPYVPKEKPCMLKFLEGIIVATGGAKNGTAAAAWAANQILRKHA